MALAIIWNDITREKTDVLVTLASAKPEIGSGVDKRVHAVAGRELLPARLEQRRKMGPGVAVCTPSFRLRKSCGAKRVVHVSSIAWEDGKRSELALLDAAYTKAVCLAVANGAKVVTVPVMGAGKFGVPKDLALDQAVRSLSDCLLCFPKLEIKLVTVEAEIYDEAVSSFEELCESHFSKKEEAEYRKLFPYPGRGDFSKYLNMSALGEQDDVYWEEFKQRKLAEMGNFPELFKMFWEWVKKRDKVLQAEGKGCRRAFFLCKMEDLVTMSGATRSTIKHILVDKKESTREETLLALCVAMGLPAVCVRVLFRKCGYEFGSTPRDKAVIEFMRTGDGSCHSMNEFLEAKGLTPIWPGKKLKKNKVGQGCVPAGGASVGRGAAVACKPAGGRVAAGEHARRPCGYSVKPGTASDSDGAHADGCRDQTAKRHKGRKR